LLHEGVGGVDGSARGGEFDADHWVFDEFLAKGFTADSMPVGIFNADSGHAEARAGKPEPLMVEVWEKVRPEAQSITTTPEFSIFRRSTPDELRGMIKAEIPFAPGPPVLTVAGQ